MTIELVALDWSGTLVDDLRVVYGACTEVADFYKKRMPTLEDFRRNASFSFLEWCADMGIEDREEVLRSKYQHALEELSHELRLVPDARETLKRLRSKKVEVGILSTHPIEKLEEETRRLGVRKYLSFIREAPRDGNGRGKETALREIMKEWRKKPAQTMMPGDTDFDVYAAKAAGAVAVAVAHDYAYHLPERLQAARPDFTIPKIKDIVHLVKVLRH